MESSLQKTSKHQRTIRFASAVCVFIPPPYPVLLSTNQFNGTIVVNGDIIRTIITCRMSALLKIGIKTLETPDSWNKSSHPFIPGLQHTQPVGLFIYLHHFYQTIIIYIGDFMGCLIFASSIKIWQLWQPVALKCIGGNLKGSYINWRVKLRREK